MRESEVEGDPSDALSLTGTNVQGIVTQARFDEDKKHFVLQTPRDADGTPVGAKWWVGNMGVHATHR